MDFKRHHQEYVSEQVESKTGDKALIWRLLRYLHPYRLILAIAVSFLFFSKIIEASIPILIGNVAQKILDHVGIEDSQYNAIFENIIQSIIFIIALVFTSYALDSINVVLKSWIGQHALYRLRMQVYNHVIHMPLAFFDRHTVGRLMTRTIHDIDQINQMFAESVIPIIGNLVLFVGIFLGIAFIDWRFALLALAILPFVWWLTHRFRYYQRICYDRVRTVVAAMNTFVQENLMGASTIRSFGLRPQSKRQFEEINDDYCNAYVESIHHFSLFIAGVDFLQNMSLIAAFVIIVTYAPFGAGSFGAGAFLTFSLYALMIFRPLADLAERYNVLQSAMAAASRIFDLLDKTSESEKGAIAGDAEGIKSIVFEDVWFAYDEENWVLKGLSLEAKEGQSYALVGLTGVGKSTIMSLLLRFYEIQKGRILINGRDIRDYALNDLRKKFCIVLQDPVIFSGTIADNISMFDPTIERKSIEEIIDYLGMRLLVDKFPEGIDHYLLEHGKGLSAGEMQLISLARAMAYHRSVLILDEATANIDTFTEQIMQEAIKKVLGRQTTLVIAHRLSTIQDASNIIVLQNGKVAETGSHHDLLDKKGVYEKLYRLQFSK